MTILVLDTFGVNGTKWRILHWDNSRSILKILRSLENSYNCFSIIFLYKFMFILSGQIYLISLMQQIADGKYTEKYILT